MNIFKEASSKFNRVIPQRDMYATSGLMLLMLISGIVMLWKMISYHKKLQTEDLVYTTSVKATINTLIVFSIFLIVLPVILLLINVTGNAGKLKSLSPFENIVKTQSIVVFLALIVLSLVIYLNTQLTKTTDSGDNLKGELSVDGTTWMASSLLLAGSVLFLIFRIISDRKEIKRLEDRFTVSGAARSLYNIGAGGISGVAGGISSAASGFGRATGLRNIDLSGIKKSVSPSGSKIVNTTAAALGYGTGYGVRSIGSGIGKVGSGLKSAASRLTGR